MHILGIDLSVANLQVKFTFFSPTMFMSHNLKSVTLATCEMFHSSEGWITFHARDIPSSAMRKLAKYVVESS